jgi:hypothetical protein
MIPPGNAFPCASDLRHTPQRFLSAQRHFPECAKVQAELCAAACGAVGFDALSLEMSVEATWSA